jgi:hypothetical protein
MTPPSLSLSIILSRLSFPAPCLPVSLALARSLSHTDSHFALSRSGGAARPNDARPLPLVRPRALSLHSLSLSLSNTLTPSFSLSHTHKHTNTQSLAFPPCLSPPRSLTVCTDSHLSLSQEELHGQAMLAHVRRAGTRPAHARPFKTQPRVNFWRCCQLETNDVHKIAPRTSKCLRERAPDNP